MRTETRNANAIDDHNAVLNQEIDLLSTPLVCSGTKTVNGSESVVVEAGDVHELEFKS